MAIDLASSYFPSWEESPLSWDELYLGGVLLPGIPSISSLTCGPKIDKQKKRKTEGQKFVDDGMKPAKFSITQTMIARHWPLWLDVLPLIYSVKPKAQRSPLSIVHPLVNSMGVDVVYVTEVKPSDQEVPEVNPNTAKKAEAKMLADNASKLGRALLESGALFGIPPAGPLLARAIYGKPQPPPEAKKGKRGDSGSGGSSGPSGKR